MFRTNSSRTQTQAQAQTQTINFSNSSNPLNHTNPSNNLTGSTGSTTYTLRGDLNSNSDDDIMFAIITGNLTKVRQLVNSTNVNNIIDRKNRYTSLHHAVRIRRNDSIIEYLLSCGADPKIKQDEGKDSIDLSIESNYRFLIDKMIKDKDVELDKLYAKYDNVNYKVKELERSNQELTKTNDYLNKSTSEYVNKIDELKEQNSNLKRKLDDSEKAFENLLKKTRKN